MKRHFQSRLPVVFFVLTIVSCIGVLLYFTTAGADTSGMAAEAEAPAATGKDAETKTPADSSKTAPSKASQPAPGCTTCHSKPEYGKYFSETKHGKLGCTFCHKGVTDLAKHMRRNEPVETASCLTCHRGIPKQGFHATVQQFSCSQCHSRIHPREALSPMMAKAAPVAQAPAPSIADCTSCHSGLKFKKHFAQTSHGKLSCTTCHSGITDLMRHMKKQQKPELTSCSVCHRDIDKEYEKSYHAVEAKISCLKCHTHIHPVEAVSGKKDKVAIIQICTICHSDRDKYVNMGHASKVLEGNKDAATCSDCHGVHNTPSFHVGESASAERARAYYTARCKTCHGNAELVARNKLRPNVVESYEETYHGKIHRAGYPAQVAGCSDCHGGHNTLAKEDRRSPVHPDNLAVTCGKCHSGAHPRFANFEAHPDYHDFKGKIALDITYLFMVGLLASVFIFFGIHTLLWWRRAYWHVCEEKGEMEKPGSMSIHGCDVIPWVRRFTWRDRIMHVLLILSFLTLVATGMPLKYSGAAWAKDFFRMLGGVESAGVLHRVAAAILWGLFLYTCWLTYKFLFPKGEGVKGWVGRLLGPDSLCFNLKDWDDLKGMFRWFFNRGPMPKFDRWTYWEKFDFFAVFWGMTAIGVSGLILWFPVASSYIMPGWLVGVAYLVHSEEALLAALFIFIMHFFHNHLVPGKFPLERNIFTGCYTLDQLKNERPLEYERIVAEGRLESMKCGYPGVWTQLFAGAFGLASLFIGLVLAFLILWAVFLA